MHADPADPLLRQALSALLEQRHSCRGFLDSEVSRQTIDEILARAQQTASWCNTQPWHVLVTRGMATRRFAHALQAAAEHDPGAPDIAFPLEYRDTYQARRRACGFQLYESVGIARGDRAGADRQRRRNFALFDAPHVAIVTTPAALGAYGAIDCGAYVATFMLAAQACGVATIAQASLASYAALIRQHFALPEDRWVVCGISFGYEDPGHPANQFRTTRARVEEAVTWYED